MMRILRFFLPGVLLLASTAQSSAQTAPVPAAALPMPNAGSSLSAEAAPDKLLLRVGLNAARALGWGGYGSYEGFLGRALLSVGAEVALSSKFTV